MIKVYVAGPYTHGDMAGNVKAAIDTADALLTAGFAPYVPHLTHFWDIQHPRPYDDWMRLDLAYLAGCDALLRLHGYSPGADEEITHAKAAHIPIFTTLEGVVKYFPYVLPLKETPRE